MRRILPFLLIFTLLLAACGSSPTAAPTADSSGVQQTTPTVDNSTAAPPATLAQREYSTDQPDLPIAGTLIAAVTPDPDAGKVFDTLTFSRTGGIAGQPLTIQLTGDGVLIRDGVTSQLTPDQVTQIVALLDKLNFFGLEGVFNRPGTSPDAFHYELTVERDGASKTIKAEDGLIPPELVELFGTIGALGA